MATIDLNRIATFVRVVEAGSFTAAANAVGLPTSSISRAVARLEDDLGIRLLTRTTRKLSLTGPGAQYFKRMQSVISEARDASAAASGEGVQPRGTVRMTAPIDFGPLELPRLLTALTRRHPGLELDLILTGRRLDLVEEGIDLAIRAGVLDDSSLIARKISSSELGVYAAPTYLAGRKRPRTPADLRGHDCIRLRGRTGATGWRLDGPGGHREVAVSGSIVADDMGFVHGAVLAGAGLGLLPSESVRKDLKAGRVVRVLPAYGLHGGGLYLVWPSQRLLPARVTLVRDFLFAELTRLTSNDLSSPAAPPPRAGSGGRARAARRAGRAGR
jgi:DNA-binding transcriptional LysR family regulator